MKALPLHSLGLGALCGRLNHPAEGHAQPAREPPKFICRLAVGGAVQAPAHPLQPGGYALDWTMIIAEDDADLARLLAEGARRMLPASPTVFTTDTPDLARVTLGALSPERLARLVVVANDKLGGSDGGGIELLAHVRSRAPAARRVLLVSHDARPSAGDHAPADAHVVLRKPFSLREAMAGIAAVM